MYTLMKSHKMQVVTISAVIFLGGVLLFDYRKFSSSSFNGRKKTSYKEDILELQVDAKTQELEAAFATRQEHLTEACLKEGRLPPISIENSSFPGKIIVETRHRILYCPVQKVGSSFWMSTLKAMTSKGRFNSPYQVVRNKKTEIQHYQNFRKSSTEHFQNWFMKNAVSLLVVRDPYTKLFSAYMDKLYHPNYLFWRITGQPIKNMIEGSEDSMCGNDISFSDFIKYIINQSEMGLSLNVHFTPIYKHCDPCSAKYDYIMKFENFKDDFYYILNQWNTRFNLNISIEDFEKETAIHVAEKHINICFSTMKQYAIKCNISAYNFLFRTWRFLQITGQIPKDVNLPFPNNENTTQISKEQLLNAVKDVLSRKIDWSHVKKQRYEALVQAYQSVNITYIKKLREIVKPDCMYFGYDEMPDYLIPAYEKSNEAFNYFDGLS